MPNSAQKHQNISPTGSLVLFRQTWDVASGNGIHSGAKPSPSQNHRRRYSVSTRLAAVSATAPAFTRPGRDIGPATSRHQPTSTPTPTAKTEWSYPVTITKAVHATALTRAAPRPR